MPMHSNAAATHPRQNALFRPKDRRGALWANPQGHAASGSPRLPSLCALRRSHSVSLLLPALAHIACLGLALVL
eukprot:1784928-Alexandrium_andersonii.AAC.1